MARHHVFCNYGYGEDDAPPCKWCEGPGKLWELYPYQDGDTAHSLVQRHFPDVRPLGDDFPLPEARDA